MGARGATGYVLGRGAGSAASNGLLTGLVAYWGLDEASGNALDKHSGGLTLTANAAPGNSTGKVYSTARTFVQASSQYFSRAHEVAIELGDVSFSVAAWVYLTAGAFGTVIAKDSTNTTNQRDFNIQYRSDTDRIRFIVVRNGGTQINLLANSHGALSLNTWILITAWHDVAADTINISINNGTVDSAATGGALQAASTWPLQIGARGNAPLAAIEYWSGRIGPVAFWKNRTLSADDRAALWNGGAGLAYAGFS